MNQFLTGTSASAIVRSVEVNCNPGQRSEFSENGSLDSDSTLSAKAFGKARNQRIDERSSYLHADILKMASDGMRHLSVDKPEPKPIREYFVREGDNLWSVAAEQLGDPTRYKEIIRLNAGKLEDEDTLSVGMRLYLPAQ